MLKFLFVPRLIVACIITLPVILSIFLMSVTLIFIAFFIDLIAFCMFATDEFDNTKYAFYDTVYLTKDFFSILTSRMK